MLTRLIIQTPRGFRFRSTLLSHGWIELAPFRYSEDYSTLYRLEQLSGGSVVHLSITTTDDEALDVRIEDLDPTPRQEEEVRDIVARMFNLRLDLQPFYNRLDGLARYQWVEAHGAGRLLRSPTVWEDLAKTLLTTNTTWSMTRAMVSRLTEIGDRLGHRGHAFPPPERVAALSLDELSDQVRAGYRNAYLHELARRIAEGRVDVERWAEDSLTASEMFANVRALKGFGPYAAGAVLKLLGYFDELAIDSAARSMFKRELHDGEVLEDGLIEKHYQHFGDWKGLVIWMDVMKGWFLEQLESNVPPSM